MCLQCFYILSSFPPFFAGLLCRALTGHLNTLHIIHLEQMHWILNLFYFSHWQVWVQTSVWLHNQLTYLPKKGIKSEAGLRIGSTITIITTIITITHLLTRSDIHKRGMNIAGLDPEIDDGPVHPVKAENMCLIGRLVWLSIPYCASKD